MKQQIDPQDLALALLQHERAARALRKDFVTKLRKIILLRPAGERGLIHENHIRETDMLEQGRIPPPIDGLGILRVNPDQFFNVGRDYSDHALHICREVKILFAVRDHEIERARQRLVLPRKEREMLDCLKCVAIAREPLRHKDGQRTNGGKREPG